MRHHNPLRQRGIGPSLTCRVGIGWIRTYGSPCKFLVSETQSREFPRSTVGLRGMAKWPAGTQPKNQVETNY